MFSTGFSKIAEQKEDKAQHTRHTTPLSVSGALVGGVAGHQAAKYLGAVKGKSPVHDAFRWALTLGAANRMGTMGGASIKQERDSQGGKN